MKGQDNLPLKEANKKRINITIDPNVWADIGRVCESKGMKKSSLVEILCKNFLGEIND